MKVLLVTPYRVNLLQRYGVTVRGNVTSVYPPLNCWTSSSVISGYHTDFHEGYGTVGAWQGRGMACVN